MRAGRSPCEFLLVSNQAEVPDVELPIRFVRPTVSATATERIEMWAKRLVATVMEQFTQRVEVKLKQEGFVS